MNNRPSSPMNRLPATRTPVSPETELRIERARHGAFIYRLFHNGQMVAARPLSGADRLLGDALTHLLLADYHRRPSDCRCNAGPGRHRQ